jgi:hypothetical protein
LVGLGLLILAEDLEEVLEIVEHLVQPLEVLEL